MKRVAVYARYSSDQQRDASVEDQLRICREYAVNRGWTVIHEFFDAAKSGASLLTRSGFRDLLTFATTGGCDIVLAESLDRLSRDQADIAHVYNRLRFAGVRMVTKADAEIDRLHIGLKGTMNAIYLDELAAKTHRGLRGRVEAGRSGGGRAYGYRPVHSPATERGELEINEPEAAIVRRIFAEYCDGVSPKAIAKKLNAQCVAGPRGAAWSPSTIHGHAGRGTGILNNELYIGRRVWNRQRYIKDPDTGKRVSRRNPQSEWIARDVPSLRIVADEVWAAAKKRQADTRYQLREGLVRTRRAKHLFSGLTRCDVCGGRFISSSHQLLICFNARDRGTCSNTRSLKRAELERRVLKAMQERLFDPRIYEEFRAGFEEEFRRLRREWRSHAAAIPQEVSTLEQRRKTIMALLLDGWQTEAWKSELQLIDRRIEELHASGRAASIVTPAVFKPDIPAAFRRMTTRLANELATTPEANSAREALRRLIDRIVIPAGDEALQVVGNVGEMLTAASGGNGSALAAVGNGGCGGRI